MMAATTIEGRIPEALLAYMAALALTPPLPVAYPGIAFMPPANAPYLRVYFIPNGAERLFIGNGEENLHQGILQVTVVYPAGQGAVTPNDVAGRIADHFGEGTKLVIAGGFIRIDKRPSIAPAMQDTDLIQIPVSINWIAYI
jgi:glycine/D-amino acid oxidase-like deaminating enzyme